MHPKKNIAFFTSGLLNYSGAATQALKVAKSLDKYNVFFFNKENTAPRFFSKSILYEKFQVITLQKFLPFRFITIIYFLLKFHVRTCHFHVFLIRNMVPCLLLGCRIILKTTLLSNDDFETQCGSKKKYFTRLILSKVSYNVVLTKNIQKINQQYITPEKVKVIYNGIKIQEMPAVKTENIFCYAGLVCPRKRTYNTILYFAEHYAHLPNAKLYIIGPYTTTVNLPEFSQQYYDSCMDLIDEFNIQSQVTFTGNIPIEEVFEIFQQAKALIFLSSKEGFPNTVLEAMSYNCVPIISHMDGVADELIVDGVDGFVLEDENRNITIEEIDRMSLSGEVYKKVNTYFTIQKTVEQLSELYEK